MLLLEHNFGHNAAVLWVTLKSIMLKFLSIMYLTLLLGCTQPPSKDRRLYFATKKATILFFLLLKFLRILAQAYCNTFWYYLSCEEYFMTTCTVRSKIVAYRPSVIFFQATCQHSFNINRRSLNRDVLSTRGKSAAELQRLQQ